MVIDGTSLDDPTGLAILLSSEGGHINAEICGAEPIEQKLRDEIDTAFAQIAIATDNANFVAGNLLCLKDDLSAAAARGDDILTG